MKEKCLNYKFLLMLPLPLFGIALGVAFGVVAFVSVKGTALFVAFLVTLMAVFLLVCTFFNEPIYYIINEEGIKVVCCFKYYSFAWNQIKHIKVFRDVYMEGLLIEDYVFYFYRRSGIPKRHEHIMKYKKTEKLIEQYYGSSKIYR